MGYKHTKMCSTHSWYEQCKLKLLWNIFFLKTYQISQNSGNLTMKWETGTPCWLECRLVPFLRRLRIVIYLLIWAVLGPRGSSRLLSSCGGWGLLSGCRVQASRRGGFFCWEHSRSSCGLWALAHRLSYFIAHVESSWTRDQTHVPCTGRRTLSPWATREVPN